jgi:hypothetical protein
MVTAINAPKHRSGDLGGIPKKPVRLHFTSFNSALGNEKFLFHTELL